MNNEYKKQRIVHNKSSAISKAQLARSFDISRITKELWSNESYRKKNISSRVESYEKRRKNFPWKNYLECQSLFQCYPSRKDRQMFCSKDCRVKVRTNKPNLKIVEKSLRSALPAVLKEYKIRTFS